MSFSPVWSIVLAFAAIKLAVHLYASGYYHYFRDELYFIACSRHLDWGYVDHPPLVVIYAWIGERLGGSLRGFRLLATIAGALRIVLTGVLAARLGGGRGAQALACLAVLLGSVYLGMDTILSMNAFYLWGPRHYKGESVILVGDEPNAEDWESLRVVDRTFHPYAMPWENWQVYHGVGLKLPMEKVWLNVKEWR